MCCHEHRDGHREPRFDEPRHRERCEDERRCCCQEPREEGFGFQRHFVSNAETILALEAYLKELENEAQGVREAIAELRKEA